MEIVLFEKKNINSSLKKQKQKTVYVSSNFYPYLLIYYACNIELTYKHILFLIFVSQKDISLHRNLIYTSKVLKNKNKTFKLNLSNPPVAQ